MRSCSCPKACLGPLWHKCISYRSRLQLNKRVQALGDAGLEARVDRNIALAAHVEARVLASGGAFQMVLPRSFANVCFWWLPRDLRPFDPALASPQQLAALGKVWGLRGYA